MIALAENLAALGRFEEAAALLKEKLVAVRQRPASHLQANYLHVLGLMLNHLQDEDAETILRDALAVARSLDETTGAAQSIMSNLADHLRLAGDFEASEALYRELVIVREAIRGPGDERTLLARRGLALCLNDQGNTEAAAQEMNKVLTGLSKLNKLHPPLPCQPAPTSNAAGANQSAGNGDCSVGQPLGGIRTPGQGPGFGGSENAQQSGSHVDQRGHYARALPLLEQVVAAMLVEPGEGSINTIAALMTLGQAHEGRGRSPRGRAHLPPRGGPHGETLSQQSFRGLLPCRPGQ